MLNLDMEYKDGKVFMGIKETKCIFEEETHKYFLVDAETGETIKELISVTTLMRKHGLSPNYDGIPTETLNKKAEYGKLVHSEIENYIKNGEIGFTSELSEFIDYIHKNDLKPLFSEFIAFNDVVAGTVDLFGVYCDATGALADYKTTATLHKEALRWQLSLYKYLSGVSADMLQAFHFTDKGLKVIDIEPIPCEEIEKLIECERNGEIYKGKQLAVADDLLVKIAEAEEKIKNFELLKKEVEAQAETLKAELLETMRTQGIKSFENDALKITYIEPTTRETIDSKRLKEELPEIADKYKKISKVKDSVRITLKGEKAV